MCPRHTVPDRIDEITEEMCFLSYVCAFMMFLKKYYFFIFTDHLLSTADSETVTIISNLMFSTNFEKLGFENMD